MVGDSRRRLFNRFGIRKVNTPWGKSQSKQKVVRGINFYSTAGHGGYKVSKKLNASIPDCLRNEDGWYEEDCEYLKVIISFPQYFSQTLRDHACRTFKLYFNNDGTYRSR